MASPRRRRTSEFPVAAAVGGGILFLLVLGIGWFFLQRDRTPEPDVTPPSATPADPGPAFDSPEVPPLDLPELGASDEFVRGLVARLSAHPQLASWLVTDDLVRRFVGVVVDLAGNANPAANVRHMAPSEPFRSRVEGGRTVIDADGYRRYDLLAATFASLDVPGTVQLFHQLRPLIDEAYEDLGIPGVDFEEAFQMAIRNLLAAEARDTPPEIELVEGIYEYRDPALEGRRGAEKALLRMGPENTRRIQTQLRALARELGMAVD